MTLQVIHVLISASFLFGAHSDSFALGDALAMPSHGLLYPTGKLADLGVDTWVVGLATRESSPGHYTLQGTFAH